MKNNPESILENLNKKATNRAELFQKRFPQLSKLITEQFQLLAEILLELRNNAQSDVEKSALIQSYRSYNCCWVACQSIRSGFLSEGTAVALTAFNSAQYIEYFIFKPHLATRWLDGNEYPVQSFYKILPNMNANQEIFLLLRECTDYGLYNTPRQLIEDGSTASFQLWGNDDLQKQLLLIKLIIKIMDKVLHLLPEAFKNNKIMQNQQYKEKMFALKQDVQTFTKLEA